MSDSGNRSIASPAVEVYRSTALSRWNVAFAALTAGLTGYVLVRGVTDHAVSEYRRVVFLAGTCLIGGALIVYCIRSALAGVLVYSGRRYFEIRNPFRTIRVLWSEAERFEVSNPATGPAHGLVRLTTGKVIRIYGIAAPNPGLRPSKVVRAQGPIDRLNTLLQQQRAIAKLAATP
jgi:hypothetical protein